MNAKFMAQSWNCECQVYFVETGRLNKKGNPIRVPTFVRKLHLHGEMIFTDYYLVNLVKRNGVKYCVKMNKPPERPYWDKSPRPRKMVREGTYDRAGFLHFLTGLVTDPLAVCVDLETCPPDNLEKAA
jgi:hypothetical protein